MTVWPFWRTNQVASKKESPIKIREVFKNHGFKITIEKDMFRTDFLGVCLCLRSKTFQPYKKNNCNVMYISNQSNHPKVTRKTINSMVNHRLSVLSSS